MCVPLFVSVAYFIPSKYWQQYGYLFYGSVCLLLIAVLFFGHTNKGSTRWLDLMFFRFQPSELAKLATVIVVAKFFSDPSTRMNTYGLFDLKYLGLMLFALFFLIAVEPDLGTASVCLLIAFAQLFFIQIRLKKFWTEVLFLASTAIVGFIFILQDYQLKRIMTFLNPENDPFGAGYNIQQSLITIGSGKILGKGYLEGTQSKLHFLPERHNDFAFPVFAEENGFIFSCFIIGLYFVLTFLILEVGRRNKNKFFQLVTIGIAANFFIQFSINIAMVLGMFPVVGMPLPLFSQGGTSLIVCVLELAIVYSISRQNNSNKQDYAVAGQYV